MKQKLVIIAVIVTLLVLLVSGCNSKTALIEEQQNKITHLYEKIAELENTIETQQSLIKKYSQPFSYLDHFTQEQLDAFERFMEQKDVRQLSSFTPEEMVLLYYHLVVNDEIEAIYLITYNNGALPDLTTFRQNFYTEGLHTREMETALDFRNYNSIQIKEESKTDTAVNVEMSVKLGIFRASILLGLKKEDEVWKIDILHLFKDIHLQNG